MTTTSRAYERHDFVRQAIDLLADGAAWNGGAFGSWSGAEIDEGLAAPLTEDDLRELARQLLIFGSAEIEAAIVDSKITVGVVQDGGDATSEVTRIEMV